MCRRRGAHCTDFSNHRCPIIGARSSMPNPSEQIGRYNLPAEGAKLHRHFHSSVPDFRERPIRSRERPIGSGNAHSIAENAQ